MGLEKHVDITIVRAQCGVVPGDDYHWEFGLRIDPYASKKQQDEIAEKIMTALDESGEFGPTYWDGHRIRFGVHSSFFGENKAKYQEYWDSFKRGDINEDD